MIDRSYGVGALTGHPVVSFQTAALRPWASTVQSGILCLEVNLPDPVWVKLNSQDGLLVTARRLDRKPLTLQAEGVNLSLRFVLQEGQEVHGYMTEGDWSSFVAVSSTDKGEVTDRTWESMLWRLNEEGWRIPPYSAFSLDTFQADSTRKVLVANNLREFAILERSQPGLFRGLRSVACPAPIPEPVEEPTTPAKPEKKRRRITA